MILKHVAKLISLYLITHAITICYATGVKFLQISPSAKSASMADAFSAIRKDINTISINPAGISQIASSNIATNHTEWFSEMKYDFLGLVFPTSYGNIGFNLTSFYIPGIERRTNFTDVSQGEFFALDLSFGITYARQLLQGDIGATLKFIRSEIDNEKTIGVSFDVGYLTNIKNVNVGVCVQNISLPMKFIDKIFYPPLLIRTGAAYTTNDFTFACEIKYLLLDNRLSFHLGVEYVIEDILSIRAGYKINSNDLGLLAGITSGIGIKIIGLSFDYSFLPYGELGIVHKFSLSFPLSRSVVEEEEIVKKMEKRIKEREEFLISKYKEDAKIVFSKGNLIEAKSHFEKVIALNPNDKFAQEEIKKIEMILEEKRKIEENKTYLARAKEYETKNELEKAIEELNKIEPKSNEVVKYIESLKLKINYTYAEKYFNEGKTLFEKGNYIDAMTKFARAYEFNSSYPNLVDMIEKTKKELTKTEEQAKIKLKIETHIKKVKEIMEDLTKYNEVMQELNEVLILEPEHEEAKEIMRITKEKYESFIKEGIKKAQKLISQGDLVSGIAELRKIEKIDPQNITIKKILKETEMQRKELIQKLYYEGLNLYAENKIEDAINKWEAVLILDPSHELAKLNIEKAKRKLK